MVQKKNTRNTKSKTTSNSKASNLGSTKNLTRIIATIITIAIIAFNKFYGSDSSSSSKSSATSQNSTQSSAKQSSTNSSNTSPTANYQGSKANNCQDMLNQLSSESNDLLTKYQKIIKANQNQYDDKLFINYQGKVNEKALSTQEGFTYCKVIKVYDGDTITCHLPGRGYDNDRVRIRFLGIDTAEANQYYGKEAGNYLRNLILNQSVLINTNDKDIYNRLLSPVFFKGENLNYIMIKEGYAYPYAKNPKTAYYNLILHQAFIDAIKDEKGMWSNSNNRCNLVNPYSFRHQ